MVNVGFHAVVERNGDNIKAVRAILDIQRREQVSGGCRHSFFLGGGNGGFNVGEVFASAGLYLDKNDRTVGSDHYNIKFAGFGRKIAGEGF